MNTPLAVLAENFWEFNALEFIAAAGIWALAVVMLGVAVRSRMAQRKTFAIAFPPDRNTSHTGRLPRSKTLPVGYSEIWIRIKARVPVELRRVRVRLVAANRSEGVPEARPTIANIFDTRLEEVPIRFRAFIGAPDGDGGFYAEYDPPQPLSHGEFVWLAAGIEADAPWEGKLSFESYDRSGRLSVAQKKLEVVAIAGAPAVDDSGASGELPTSASGQPIPTPGAPQE